ncbi:hypothetical protein A9P82_04795 [Arachidicoccus ginsenosidimutans]|uniref:FecR family protein n=1 Tax=Arachidicoccus sp. BS20 TaxID=1850526 RepID=UPI0007F1483F|nr:FecR family protein [Arachidicoccus sp. BS20]ANI88662.1 hypothetical protein A9P82_04795 [Arachidicoccus sp. BS20]
MSDKQYRIQYLLEAYANRTHTHEELDELFSYIREAKNDESLYAFMKEYYYRMQLVSGLQEPDWERMFSGIVSQSALENTLHRKKIRFYFPIRYAAAVIVLIALSIGIYLYNEKQVKPKAVIAASSVIDVAPGTNKAVLTLADGSLVQLDSAGQKQLKQGSASIQQFGGKLLYEADNESNSTAYNTLSTPRGGQYHLVLSDGTQVWLNAASSIKYPVVFTDKKREVSITGEAYFEVKHDAEHPFIVRTGNQITEDIGTAFDIDSYADEAGIKTTLVEGAVQVNDRLLHPGQQALVTGGSIKISEANTEEATAWKNGLFYFENNDFASVMKTLSRWYDIDVVYKDNIPKRRFEGKVPRSYNLGDLLEVLKASDIHFSLEGKKLIVEP